MRAVHMALAACADKAKSGVMDQPCAKVAKYCHEQMFAAKLAANCPKTCGKCKAAKTKTKAPRPRPTGTFFKSSNPASSLARRSLVAALAVYCTCLILAQRCMQTWCCTHLDSLLSSRLHEAFQ